MYHRSRAAIAVVVLRWLLHSGFSMPSNGHVSAEEEHSAVKSAGHRDLKANAEFSTGPGMGSWVNEVPEAASPTTYSVIVVASNPHVSNLFRDKDRVGAYSQGVISVKFASPHPLAVKAEHENRAPFSVTHAEGADVRVTIVHATDFVEANGVLDDKQVSHLKAVCEDTSQNTILLISDETCARRHIPSGVPAACWSNIVRHYPYNAPSPAVETRNAYVPLGPRENFRFVETSHRTPASDRPLLFNIEVTRGSSPRRFELVDIVDEYTDSNIDVPCHTQEFRISRKHQLHSEQWQTLLKDSKFTLAPGGYNPETYRLFEALEAGSIPIVSKQDYMDPAGHGDHPCGEGTAAWSTVASSPFANEVSVDTWQDLPLLLDRLREEPADAIDKLQIDCMAWYETLMNRTYASLLNFGLGLELWPQAGSILEDFRPPPT